MCFATFFSKRVMTSSPLRFTREKVAQKSFFRNCAVGALGTTAFAPAQKVLKNQ
jgi:hypothetical protein